ncbi:MAG: Na+/H+ antiporter NhaA [Lysobacterales bacterium]
MLGGMGFTMSIFIATLSFAQDPGSLLAAKTAILLASFIAGVSGYFWLRSCR